MMIVNKQLQQFAIGILTVLSLLVSSASACTCSHHHAESDTGKSSLHSHSEMSEFGDSHHSRVENTASCLASDSDCVCEAATAKLVAKSDWIKFDKHIATVSLEKADIAVAVFQPLTTVRIDFAKPFYLSNSFYDLAPKRGPPNL